MKSNPLFAKAFSDSSWVYIARTKIIATESKPSKSFPMQKDAQLTNCKPPKKHHKSQSSPFSNIRIMEKKKLMQQHHSIIHHHFLFINKIYIQDLKQMFSPATILLISVRVLMTLQVPCIARAQVPCLSKICPSLQHIIQQPLFQLPTASCSSNPFPLSASPYFAILFTLDYAVPLLHLSTP